MNEETEAAATRPRRWDWGLVALLITWSAWALAYIWNTSFVIEGKRYFCLFDDGMISMRYAMNLAQGHGLVWNAGEAPIEGYTNLLWTLVMAAVHWVGVPLRGTSLVIQLLGLLFLMGNIICTYLITLRLSGASRVCACAAAFLIAFSLPLNTWGLQGMEVSLLVFLISLSILLFLRQTPTQPAARAPFVLLALAVLTRPDMVVPFLVFLVVVVLYHRQTRWRDLGVGAAILVVTVLAVTCFRWVYYGDCLPNTYYLKMTGAPALLRITRGAFACRDFVETMGLLLFALPAGYALFHLRNRAIALLAGLFAGQLLYSIYVGGDAWEWFGHYANRYVCVAMPGFFVLLVLALKRVCIPEREAAADVAPLAWLRPMVVLGLTGVCWLAVHGATPGWKLTVLARNLSFRNLPLHVANNAKHTAAGLWLHNVCPTNSLVATHWAGSTPYFSRLPTADLFGKSDKRIAHQASGAKTWREVYPGHDKYDYAYSLDELKPVVVVTPFPEAIEAHGYDVVIDAMDDVRILGRRDDPLATMLVSQTRKASTLYAPLAQSWRLSLPPTSPMTSQELR